MVPPRAGKYLVHVAALVLLAAALCGAASVGVLYEPWHGYAANAMKQVASLGGKQLSVEQVIRSNGSYKLSDVLDKYGLRSAADGFFYHVTPQLGFYCIYRHRTGETGYIPDCDNITYTLTTQAQWLTDASVDFVVVDSSNLGSLNSEADVLQVRPTEVLFEEWHQLRLAGIPTPQIAVWPCIPPGSNVYKYYLDLYNNDSYADLVMHNPSTGRKVMFIVQPPDAGRQPDTAILQEIENNGIDIVMMWALMAQSSYSKGVWGFFSGCNNNGKNDLTSIVGEECQQSETYGSVLGTEVSAAPSFQTSYSSLPFCAAGKLQGLTFRKQFKTVFADQPQYVFISSWNEFIAQPQANPYSSYDIGFSMGMSSDPDRSLWVDTYGSGFGRDVEPSVEYGNKYYELMASCIRVYKSGSTKCSNASEPCCGSSEGFTNVWSLHLKQDDYLLTTDENEKNILTGQGWTEARSTASTYEC
eukprot:TRINITY_DN1316_c0_g1_i7.p1 TRINITY_DN1316_c0_g1~~TRINITY_DN1316_c0_g1_i7.p1  ORF type:complete len:471 (+),score=105.20 TRINITY_DN1316_c0_g1_i7:1925-3337(+)